MWLAVLDGNEEAQALFVTGDGLSAVLSVTADKNMPEELRLVCVMFLECLVGWVLEDAVKKGKDKQLMMGLRSRCLTFGLDRSRSHKSTSHRLYAH